MSYSPKDHLERVHSLHCVVCLNCYGKWRSAKEAHHLEAVRAGHSDYATVPLCQQCHGELHAARRRPFMIAHKLTDVKLLAWTIKMLGEQEDEPRS